MKYKKCEHHISLTVISNYNCMFMYNEAHNNYIHIPDITNNYIYIPNIINNHIHIRDVINKQIHIPNAKKNHIHIQGCHKQLNPYIGCHKCGTICLTQIPTIPLSSKESLYKLIFTPGRHMLNRDYFSSLCLLIHVLKSPRGG